MASQHQHALDPRLGVASPSTPLAPQHQHQHQQQLHPQLQYEHPPPTSQQHPNAHIAPYAQPSPQAYYPTYPPPPHGQGSSGSPSQQASPSVGTFQQPQQQQQTPGDGGEHSADDGGNEGGGSDEAKRPRACEACRGLKVRCDQDPLHPDIPCRRCQKANRPCIITAPSRKRQKKADNRVADLERKLDALTAVLQQQQQQQMMQSPQQYAPMQQPSAPPAGPSMQPPQKRRRIEDGSPSQHHARFPSLGSAIDDNSNAAIMQAFPNSYMMPPRSQEELLNRIHALVSPEMGVELFDRYVVKLSPHMPAVVFPPGTTAEHIRQEAPILYLCILAAASSGILPTDISSELTRESIRIIADCVVCNGAKSLELIQAMQVTALWYKPPEKAEQTNFYQIIHMAAVMAIDIGLGKRFNGGKAKRGLGGSTAECPPGAHVISPQNSDTLEARRAWLGCYYMCASASMVLRRPNLVHWSNYMKECVDILETSPEASPSDKMFCQHIKIQHICEEIGVQFLMDDNTATVSITDPKVTYTLNVLENDLKAWKDNIPNEYKDHPSMIFFEHVASLYLHEIALHFNHNVEDFRLPFTEESLKTVPSSSETLTQHQVSALIACRTAAHGILDTMLAFDIDTIKSLPMLIYFVRCTYSIVILIKMHVSVSTPGSELAKMMTAKELRVEYYLDGLLATFARVHSEKGEEFHQFGKILRITSVLREWFVRHKVNVEVSAGGGDSASDPQQKVEGSGGPATYPMPPTPLDLLSQAAAGNQRPLAAQQRPSQEGAPPPASMGNWSANGYSYPMDSHPGQFSQQQIMGGAYTPTPVDTSTWTPGEAPYGIDWGSGFQQAMDLNLGGMEGLNGGGIDGLFFGDGIVPFGNGGGHAGGFNSGGEF
ncbi:uncharacterized protein RCC_08054 [Ramularia collo-cygni]|uniref:Zn(2)-C6 fungal-type domain-containing protein n=1 Tax=Ramularia collo-cygni TaxID=112498 RepID=A0A2D3V661_9PEZI|nr:uncharacterized protein RCC_08054 [Ramularia collo-cygni]CZT22185.1 uncharacterized protein RCC_08054 [Ramularia collo-cygni]